MLGETISHYKIIEKPGQGGIGEVYLTENNHSNPHPGLPPLLILNDLLKSPS